MKTYTNALNIDYSLYCQQECRCNDCGNESIFWWLYDGTMSLARKLDELGWVYEDYDALVCPSCNAKKANRKFQLSLFDDASLAAAFAVSGHVGGV